MSEAEKTTVKTLVEEALRKAKGDWGKALDLSRAEVMRRKNIQQAILLEALDGHLWYEIRQAAIRTRQNFFNGQIPPKEDSGAFEKAAAQIAKEHWYQFPLPGGTLLGEATKDDLIAAHDLWQAMAEANARRAAWVSKLIPKVPAGKRVRDVLSEKKIAALSMGAFEVAA